MLERLTVVNLPSGSEPYLPFPQNSQEGQAFFVLKTCLRTLIIDFEYPAFRLSSNTFSPPASLEQEVFIGEEAYIFIQEVLCGLRSKLVGENEIVGQFKQALSSYLKHPLRQTALIKVLEKMLKDAKEIRASHLNGVTQKSYAALARKLILKKGNASQVLLLGSGALCLDLIHQLQKKVPLVLSARNTPKVEELSKKYALPTIRWEEFGYYQRFPHIICTISAQNSLFGTEFFSGWSEFNPGPRMFLNFGPSTILSTELSQSQGVYRLDDLFEEEKNHELKRKDQIYLAHLAIRQMVNHRKKFWPSASPTLSNSANSSNDQERIFA